MTGTIVFLDPMVPARLERIAALVPEGFVLRNAASRAPDDQLDAIRGARFAVAGDVPVTAQMMAEGAAHGLEAVHKWGVGYDNLDLEAAREAGVRVLRTTGSNAVAVAESALALMLAVNRQTVTGHVALQSGSWSKGDLGSKMFRLSGQTVGLVGLGYIGKALARLLSGFGCAVLYTKPTRLAPEEEAALGVTYAPLDELLGRSDIVSLHCPLSEATRGLIDAAALQRMKRGTVLINVARGGLVDEAALIDAVASGHLRGVGVDVYETEPLPAGHGLIGLPGVVTTPHIAALAADNFAPTLRRIFDNFVCLSHHMKPATNDILV